MKILVYSTKAFERPFLEKCNTAFYDIEFTNEALSIKTALLAKGFDVISIFTGDDASAPVIKQLHKTGVQFIAVRAAGYDNVDVEAAGKHDILVANVPEYSPYAIAEHAVAMILSLNRKIALAQEQVQRYDFTLDNLIGYDLYKKTVGIIGTGKIGSVFAKIMHGFGCNILAYDIQPNQKLINHYAVRYTGLTELCRQSDIISIHTPLTKETKHLIAAPQIKEMKKGVMLINTARGAIVNTNDIIDYLQNGHIGFYGMDVYEKERGVFFYDHSGDGLHDPLLLKLLKMPNVLVTPHQAFATEEALNNIAVTTFDNIQAWAGFTLSGNELNTRTSLVG